MCRMKSQCIPGPGNIHFQTVAWHSCFCVAIMLSQPLSCPWIEIDQIIEESFQVVLIDVNLK